MCATLRRRVFQFFACGAVWLCGLLCLLMVDAAWADHLPATTPVLPGSDHRHENHAGADYSTMDLRGVDFSEASLLGANLFDTFLDGARFVDADMSGANLWNATIGQADFSGADLSGATLRNMRGTSPVFADADLTGVDMDDTHFEFADMRNVVFDGANLAEFTSFRTNFRGANLSGALSIDAHFEALYDSATLLPAGFDPTGAGWIFVPEPAGVTLALYAAGTCVIGLARRRWLQRSAARRLSRAAQCSRLRVQ